MEAVNSFLSGVLIPLVLLAVGFYFACRTVPLFLCHLRQVFRGLRGATAAGEGSPLRALSVALAGTLGVGNIAGVAIAVTAGGAGAVFWLWVAAFLAMPLKYAEVVLAQRFRVFKNGRVTGGAMYYIKEAFGGRVGRFFAAFFAVLCICCALTLGSVVQASAAAEAMASVFRLPPLFLGAMLAAFMLFVLARGSERVTAVCAGLVPFACVLFSVASLAVLFLARATLPAAFAAIFKEAFTARGVGGGVLGVLGSRALRFGVARGIISNEAGCGTAPIAHAAANVKGPAEQGLFGILEVFVDTVLLCTMTALVLLVSGTGEVAGGGVATALSAFGAVLGPIAPPVLALCILLFAVATLLCWAHYGRESLAYLTESKHAARVLSLCLSLAALLGAVAAPAFVWGITDLTVSLMVLVNITALLFLRQTVVLETKRYFDK